jgi:hypothetical protein
MLCRLVIDRYLIETGFLDSLCRLTHNNLLLFLLLVTNSDWTTHSRSAAVYLPKPIPRSGTGIPEHCSSTRHYYTAAEWIRLGNLYCAVGAMIVRYPLNDVVVMAMYWSYKRFERISSAFGWCSCARYLSLSVSKILDAKEGRLLLDTIKRNILTASE